MSRNLKKNSSSGNSQSEKISENQVRNNAGGFVFQVDDMTRLRRFICLGTEKGTYYAKEGQLKAENAESIQRLIKDGKGVDAVNEIIQYSVEGRTAKQDPIIFALALCVRFGDGPTRQAAYGAVSKICRIPTFLFAFIEFIQSVNAAKGTGWGRGMKREISNWYNSREPKDLAFTITKYKNRNGWNHRDVLRLGHVKPTDEAHNIVFRYAVKGSESFEESEKSILKLQEEREQEQEEEKKIEKEKILKQAQETLTWLKSLEEAMKLPDGEQEKMCEAVKKLRLAREHLPTQFLNSVSIWATLLEEMPMTAMIRNLSKMTAIQLLKDESSQYVDKIVQKLKSVEALRKAKVHTFNDLDAMRTYAKGHGEKGKLTWNPVKAIVQALEEAFVLSFKAIEPTNQRVVIGLDVSGSMSSPVLGSEAVSCREASMAISMVTMKIEPKCTIMAFCGEFVPLKGVSKDNSLDANLNAISNLPFGSTDCSQPMVWALKNKIPADTFIILTDNDTWAGQIQPSQALVNYRNEMKIPHAKLIVVGMTSTQFSIADPNDAGMLDVAGFDSNGPEVMRNFMLGLF